VPAQAFIEGAWWNVRSSGPPLEDGALVRIVDVDGLDLLAEPYPGASSETETPRTDAQ
jgi:membrane protein implicated in regulation of membrane protease activity